MELNDQLTRAVEKYIAEHWKRGCPYCGAHSWDIAGFENPPVAEHIDLASFGVLGGAATMPLAAVICTNCGNATHLNLIIAGLAPRDV